MPNTNDEKDNEQNTQEKLNKKIEGAYTAADIQVLEGLEAVRKRPGMFVGDNGKKGLHQMFREVLDNSVDEALAGHCTEILVKLYRDGSLSVDDNGRGIPVGIMKKEKKSALEVIMTVLHAGGKFGGSGYKVSGGLHGVGVSCTNALSEWLIATVHRDGKIHRQSYAAGKPTSSVDVVGESDRTGTIIQWLPDKEILTTTEIDRHIIKHRLKEIAYLNAGLKIVFEDEVDPEQNESYCFKQGIVQLVEDMNSENDPMHKPIYFQRVRKGMEIEVAMQYQKGYSTNLLAYSNNIHQPDGGTHVSGFGQALTRVINSYGRKMNLIKEKEKNFSADDVAEGLTCVIALKLEEPSYNSQDKVKLVTPEVQGATNSLVGDGLQEFLEENPGVAKGIVIKASIAQRAREEARKAAEAIKRSSAMDSFGLPGKLSDCVSKNAEECEIFLVEGESAGGSAKQARDRMTQAVLALRGKILNVERARLEKALDNEEIKSLIASLGVGIAVDTIRGGLAGANGDADENGSGHNFDLSKLRYHKIIIMTDADVDGEHIRTLLLTFFYRYMKPLVVNGHIYLAQPPLFVIKVGSSERHFAASEEERDEIVSKLGRKKYTVTRFKGLGEMMAEELEETTMSVERRKLVRINYDPQYDVEIEAMFSRLMGDKVEPRREYIERHAKLVTNLDWHY